MSATVSFSSLTLCALVNATYLLNLLCPSHSLPVSLLRSLQVSTAKSSILHLCIHHPSSESTQTLSSPRANVSPSFSCKTQPLPVLHCLSEHFPTHRLNPSPSLALLFPLNFLSCRTAPFSYVSHPPFLLLLLQNPHLQSTPTSLLLLRRPHFFFPLTGKHSYLRKRVLKINLDFNYCPTFALVMKVLIYKKCLYGA